MYNIKLQFFCSALVTLPPQLMNKIFFLLHKRIENLYTVYYKDIPFKFFKIEYEIFFFRSDRKNVEVEAKLGVFWGGGGGGLASPIKTTRCRP